MNLRVDSGFVNVHTLDTLIIAHLFLYVHVARVFTEEEGGWVRGRTPSEFLGRLLPLVECQLRLGPRVRELAATLRADDAAGRRKTLADHGAGESP